MDGDERSLKTRVPAAVTRVTSAFAAARIAPANATIVDGSAILRDTNGLPEGRFPAKVARRRAVAVRRKARRHLTREDGDRVRL